MTEILKIIFVAIFTFIAGFADSIAGGGGLISLPAYLAIGLPAHSAIASNKFSATFGTLIASYKFYNKKLFDLDTAVFSIIFAFIASNIGTRFMLLMNPDLLKKALILIVPLVAIIVLKNKNIEGDKEKQEYSKAKKRFIASLIGLFIGFYDGLIGPGTGTFCILAYNYFLGFDFLKSSANAKLINSASNVSSLFLLLFKNQIIFAYAIPAAITGIIGNYLGSEIAINKGGAIIKKVIIWILILLLIKLVYDIII